MSMVEQSRPLPGRTADPQRDTQQRIAWLAAALAQNRFMPLPARSNVGDGDFRAIGAEFLQHFVEIGNLVPDERVLDVGCGIGRIALPLTQYIDPQLGSYDGFDPVLSGVEWCVKNITAVYPRFRFVCLDVQNDLYNPEGAVSGADLVFPYADACFDFVAMVSVATHMSAPEVEAYVQESARVLAPGGRLFLTAFVVGASRHDEARPAARLRFTRWDEGQAWRAHGDHALAAVGFSDGFVEGALAEAGLTLRRRKLGHWRGVRSAHFQDIFVAEKRGDAR